MPTKEWMRVKPHKESGKAGLINRIFFFDMSTFLSHGQDISSLFWTSMPHAPPEYHGFLSFDTAMGKKSTSGHMRQQRCRESRFSVPHLLISALTDVRSG